MRCPVDNETLVMTERNGVEIDYCPKCRGVWLDRGELDKILERAGGPTIAPVPAAPPAPPSAPVYQQPPQDPYAPQRREEDRRRRDYDDDDDHYRGGKPYKKRRESWLGDIFDF
ncbi:TFIIB-type zinc ribbon-containing protein [Neogemmobacter tilapiae]|uniref:Transcription factor zinc-finger domain-containing protein n=1 Tax=Neogemmobacter tilapiae TaxID=875041 RepID=A0A918TKZ5_9RHOB|nr:zf-TFIIB domain-containing protein [Gemmobacter tilapiae]GHC52490.1 hypothetical protein GCM10007315_13730 [Gemmobacter tilapiae]